MSYTPTEWHTGDIVTANKLNNLEQGVVDAQLPAYSASDNGKVLGLGEGTPVETVIVPEQALTVTSDSTPVISNLDEAYFVVGQECTLTVGGNSYSVTIAETSPSLDPTPIVECDAGDSVMYHITLYNYDYVFDAIDNDSGELIPGTYTVSLTTSVPAVEPKWTEVEVGETYTIPNALNTTMQTLLGTIIQYIVTNSKTTLVGDSTTYSGADSAEIVSAIRNLADTYIEGRHVTVDVMGMKCAPAVLSKSEYGGEIQAILPHYKITSPITKEFTIYIQLVSLHSGSSLTGINVYIGMQAWDSTK